MTEKTNNVNKKNPKH